MTRVLMLHGYTRNAAYFSKKSGALRKSFKQHNIEAVFLDAPHIIPEATEADGTLANLDAEEGVDDPENQQRMWWDARTNADGSKTYRGFGETMAYIREFLDKEEPFDCVFGFSQGAALAAVLCILARHPHLHPTWADRPSTPFRTGVFVGGFPVVDPELSSFWTQGLEPTPNLHVCGKQDTIVGSDRSDPLVAAFAEPRVEYHEGGHFVPFSAAWRTFLCEWIASNGSKDVPSPTAPRL